MSICGNSVQALIKDWDIELTAENFAALASDHGIRLDGTLRSLNQSFKLPKTQSFWTTARNFLVSSAIL
jgi:hypothetical protein